MATEPAHNEGCSKILQVTPSTYTTSTILPRLPSKCLVTAQWSWHHQPRANTSTVTSPRHNHAPPPARPRPQNDRAHTTPVRTRPLLRAAFWSLRFSLPVRAAALGCTASLGSSGWSPPLRRHQSRPRLSQAGRENHQKGQQPRQRARGVLGVGTRKRRAWPSARSGQTGAIGGRAGGGAFSRRRSRSAPAEFSRPPPKTLPRSRRG